MSYETNRQKISNYFFKVIYPRMDLYGIDQNKTISTMATELSVSTRMVEDFFRGIVQSGKIIETKMFELTKEEIQKREDAQKEVDKEIEEVLDLKPIDDK